MRKEKTWKLKFLILSYVVTFLFWPYGIILGIVGMTRRDSRSVPGKYLLIVSIIWAVVLNFVLVRYVPLP